MIALMFLPLLLQSSDTLPECDQAAVDKGIQADMNQCAFRDFLIADRELNAQWAITAAAMKARDAAFGKYGGDQYDSRAGWFENLLEAQRAWLRYRDAHCRVDGYTARGGSMEPLLYASCKTHLTEMRTEELKALAVEL